MMAQVPENSIVAEPQKKAASDDADTARHHTVAKPPRGCQTKLREWPH